MPLTKKRACCNRGKILIAVSDRRQDWGAMVKTVFRKSSESSNNEQSFQSSSRLIKWKWALNGRPSGTIWPWCNEISRLSTLIDMSRSLGRPAPAGRNRTLKTRPITETLLKLSTSKCSSQSKLLRNTGRLGPQSLKIDSTDRTSTTILRGTSSPIRKSTKSIQRLAWLKTVSRRQVTSSPRKNRRLWARCLCKRSRSTNRQGASLTPLSTRDQLSLSAKARAWSRAQHSVRLPSGLWLKKTQAELVADAANRSWETIQILGKAARTSPKTLSPTSPSLTPSAYLKTRLWA